MISKELDQYIEVAIKGIKDIPLDRIEKLDKLVNFICEHKNDTVINLIFICVHNSRRSHFAQIWAQIAAHYFGLTNIQCYSGGTAASSIYPAVIKSMKNCGLQVQILAKGQNPVYALKYDSTQPAIIGFSKLYDNAFNPLENFAG